jgi:hypothetical protein
MLSGISDISTAEVSGTSVFFGIAHWHRTGTPVPPDRRKTAVGAGAHHLAMKQDHFDTFLMDVT